MNRRKMLKWIGLGFIAGPSMAKEALREKSAFIPNEIITDLKAIQKRYRHPNKSIITIEKVLSQAKRIYKIHKSQTNVRGEL